MAAEGAPETKAPEGGGKGLKGALSRKIGPLPVVVWIGIAIVVFYYVSKRNGGGAAQSGPETDPAGNVGTINPQTGYVYGSTEDQAALGSGSGSIGSSADEGTGGSTVAGQYADNNAWAVAAINYLVSISVDATAANTAVTQFLGSQQLTTDQQAMINLVIQRIGAPPSPPEPGGSNPPIVNPPTSSTYAANPPTGFTTTTTTSSTIGAKWNAAVNAVSYTLSWGTTADAKDGSTTVSTPSGTATGLKASTLYHLRVQANPAKGGSAYASLTKTTSKATTTTKPPSKPPASHAPSPYKHTVTKDGESYSSIAKQYHYSKGGHALWVYNYSDSPHTKEAKKTIKARGPNKLYHGSTVYIPRS
jgi:hypothetical protein